MSQDWKQGGFSPLLLENNIFIAKESNPLVSRGNNRFDPFRMHGEQQALACDQRHGVKTPCFHQKIRDYI